MAACNFLALKKRDHLILIHLIFFHHFNGILILLHWFKASTTGLERMNVVARNIKAFPPPAFSVFYGILGFIMEPSATDWRDKH